MKFSCERCGKRYATAETPAPGRVYKLKCKACGHLIVVRASSGSSTAAASTRGPGGMPPGDGTPHRPGSETTPEIALEIAVPEQGSTNGSGGPLGIGEATVEISVPPEISMMPEISTTPPEISTTPELPVAVPPEEDFKPPPGDTGYVDLFSDVGGSGAAPLRPREEKPDDPFLAAARASLPESYGSAGPAPDPFGPLREGALREGGEAPARTPPPLPKIPVIPKPPPQKTALPLGLIGGGVAVLVGILAFVLVDSGKKEKAPPPRPAAATPVPEQAAAPPLVPPAPELERAPPPAEPPPPKPEPPPAQEARRPREDERGAREERRRREREEAKERAAREREAKERERKAREERDARERERRERDRLAAAAIQDDAEGGLTQAQIEAVLRSTKKAFDGCLQSARGTESKLDGRRVMLRLNIQTSGTVTYPTLDDVTLNGTELGACLKSAARLMVFPKFKGDTMHVEVPLVMR